MNLFNYLRLYSLVFALLLPISIVGEGFVAGTLVCTPQGYVPIEELSVGDEVITSDLNFYRVAPITHVTRCMVEDYVRIKIKDVVIDVAADHPFLLPCEQRWERACNLTARTCLVGAPLNAEFIDAVERVQQPTCVYTLSLENYHTYLVSERNIMVHNNDTGSLVLELAKGSGVIGGFVAASVFVPPVAILAGGGTLLGLVVWSFIDGFRSSRRSSHDDSSNVTSQSSSHGGFENGETDFDNSQPVRGFDNFDGFESEESKFQKEIAADELRRELAASSQIASSLGSDNEPSRTCGTGDDVLAEVKNSEKDITQETREDVHEISSFEQSHNNAEQEKKEKKKDLAESKQQRDSIDPSPDPKKDNNDKYENMYEVFARASIGKKLKEAVEGTSRNYRGIKLYRVIKDVKECGIQKGDWLYLDKLHKDHIEVFCSKGKPLRTILNMDGTQNLAKIQQAGKRDILECL